MAFDPTKIGAQYRYQETEILNASTAVATQLVGFNPYRVAIYFCCNSGVFYIRPTGVSAVNKYFQCQNPSPQLRFTMQDSGPLCQQAWSGFPNNASNEIYVLEVIWIPESTS